MSYSKEQRIINKMHGSTISNRSLPNHPEIVENFDIPNHSGDHSAGRVLKTPTTDYEIVNKKYVDDEIAIVVEADLAGHPHQDVTTTASPEFDAIDMGGYTVTEPSASNVRFTSQGSTTNYLNFDLGEDWEYGTTISAGGSGGGSIRFGDGIVIANDRYLTIGNSGRAGLRLDTSGGAGLHVLRLETDVTGEGNQSGYVFLCEKGDDRTPSSAVANPTWRIYSGDGTEDDDYFEMYHDGTAAIFNIGNGEYKFNTDVNISGELKGAREHYTFQRYNKAAVGADFFLDVGNVATSTTMGLTPGRDGSIVTIGSCVEIANFAFAGTLQIIVYKGSTPMWTQTITVSAGGITTKADTQARDTDAFLGNDRLSVEVVFATGAFSVEDIIVNVGVQLDT